METNSILREALERAKEIARTIYSTSETGSPHEDLAEKIVEIAHAALAEPPRNCDVGTADEQWARFKKHCEENSQADDPGYCSGKCNVDGGCVSQCALKWAQMPYE